MADVEIRAVSCDHPTGPLPVSGAPSGAEPVEWLDRVSFERCLPQVGVEELERSVARLTATRLTQLNRDTRRPS